MDVDEKMEKDKMGNGLSRIFVAILLLLSILPASLGQTVPIDLHAEWASNGQPNITVTEGDQPDVFVFVVSPTNFQLTIDILDLQTLNSVRQVLNQATIPANLQNNFGDTFTIDTTGLQGDYIVSVEVQNSQGSDTVSLGLHVNPATPPQNQPPVLTSTPPPEATEGIEYRYELTANDSDNNLANFQAKRPFFVAVRDDGILSSLSSLITGTTQRINKGSLSFSNNLPTGASMRTLIDPQTGERTGLFTWTPPFTFVQHPNEVRNTDLLFRACDDDSACSDWQELELVVNDANRAPVADDKQATTTVGQAVNIQLTAVDPDSEDTVSYSRQARAQNGQVTIQGSIAQYIPNSGFIGTDTFTYVATDNHVRPEVSTPADVTISVTAIPNNDPVLNAIGNRRVQEGDRLQFTISATDADNDPLSFTTSSLPTGANFADNNDGTATFDWTPQVGQTGVYPVTFTVSDGSGGTDQEVINVNVTPRESLNRDPVLNPIGNQNAQEGNQLQFTVSASDADNDPLSLTVGNLPTGANFADNNDGTATFDWTPQLGQTGTYSVTFTVTDGRGGTDQETIVVTVNAGPNNAPVLNPIGDQNVQEGGRLQFSISASDADNDALTFTTQGLPAAAIFTDNGNGAAIVDWQTNLNDAGRYLVTFTVNDGRGGTDQESITINVNNQNQNPVLNPIGDRTVLEGAVIDFTVSAIDSDNDPLQYTVTSVPSASWAGFTDNGDGTGRFRGTPGFNDEGTYSFTFLVEDGNGGSASETITITVGSNNAPPTIRSNPGTIGREDELYTYQIDAVDPDNDPLTYTLVRSADSSMTLDQNGLLEWTPERRGRYSVVIRVSDGVTTVEQRFAISVRSVDRNLKISSARLSQEVAYPGDHLHLHTNVDNNGDTSLDDVSIRATLYELQVYSRSGEFDLDVGDSRGENMNIMIPYHAPPGDYYLRIMVGNDQFHDTIYRLITII